MVQGTSWPPPQVTLFFDGVPKTTPDHHQNRAYYKTLLPTPAPPRASRPGPFNPTFSSEIQHESSQEESVKEPFSGPSDTDVSSEPLPPGHISQNRAPYTPPPNASHPRPFNPTFSSEIQHEPRSKRLSLAQATDTRTGHPNIEKDIPSKILSSQHITPWYNNYLKRLSMRPGLVYDQQINIC